MSSAGARPFRTAQGGFKGYGTDPLTNNDLCGKLRIPFIIILGADFLVQMGKSETKFGLLLLDPLYLQIRFTFLVTGVYLTALLEGVVPVSCSRHVFLW